MSRSHRSVVRSRNIPLTTSWDHQADPFRVPLQASAPLHHRVALTLAQPILDWTLGLPRFRQLYRKAIRAEGATFTARALGALDIDVTIGHGSVHHFPASGPLLIIGNHPHGILDGLALAHLAHQRRADVRVLTSHLLASIPDLADLCLFVDPFGGRSAVARSRAGLRAARRWLDDGHALIVFPAGSVADGRRDARETPRDSAWHTTAVRLAASTGATLVPAFIQGGNSNWFYRAGSIHPRLRTLLLGRELLRQRGRSVTVHLGEPLPIPVKTDPVAMTHVLRREVERLGSLTRTNGAASVEAVGPGPAAEALEDEIRALPHDALVIRSGSFQVFCASAADIPLTLREIGRLREISFRTVGEGTGKAQDLDRFDAHYRHLFVWNRDAREIAGAYRLGLTEEIVAGHGVDGLYTSTLFRYDARLLARMGPAIELGRSFVRAEYQRSSNALLLLWKGIARVVAQTRQYRVLFGPVSISRRYGDTSQQLLKEFLTQNHYRRDLATLVEAVTPPRSGSVPCGFHDRTLGSVAELDRAIAGIESDGKGIPVLLRQYLKLNAKLLGFNVDPNFGHVLDALMMVDLADVSPAVLRRYFGDDARHFVASDHVAA